ncbi:MAG: ribosome maturation factor RimM [Pseudomonadales bacterium]
MVGRIVGAFGVQGWLRVQSFTEPPQNLSEYRNWYIETATGWRELETDQRKWRGDRLTVHVKGCDDRDQAQALAQHNIGIASEELPNLAVDEFYWHQLQGLQVFSEGDVLLGKVDRLLETGANDVLVVTSCDGSIDNQERLIPYLPGQVVKAVNLAAGEMRVDWDPTF